jgi:uncharacterized Fe-S cluster-containing radical SAM superfamily protein
VAFTQLETLWLNTGTRCNLECRGCYIESSPTNDRLEWLRLADAAPLLDEARAMDARLIGLTGGEPFMNPDIIALLAAALDRGFDVLALTNAMRPMRRHEAALKALRLRHGHRLRLRVSLDHWSAAVHDAERGAGAFDKALQGLSWLATHGFDIAVAGRHLPDETEARTRAGFAGLFAAHGLPLDAGDPHRLVLFAEMDAHADVAEISQSCWSILGRSPASLMCATGRMAVKRRGAAAPVLVACTLLPYEPGFELGATLAEAAQPVALNHPHCARFCVLGGSSCAA